MNLENMEKFIKHFLNKSITLILNFRYLSVVNSQVSLSTSYSYNLKSLKQNDRQITEKIESELAEILDVDYLSRGCKVEGMIITNKSYFIDIILMNNKWRILLERWEFQCEYTYSFLMDGKEDLYSSKIEEDLLLESLTKNLINILNSLPLYQKDLFELGFKIYNSRTNYLNFAPRKCKLVRIHSAGRKFSLSVRLHHLEVEELQKIVGSLAQTDLDYLTNLMPKRRRCFSEGDKQEINIKIIDRAVINENYFNKDKSTEFKDSFFSKIDDQNKTLCEVIIKYKQLKEKLNKEINVVNFWSYLNMYFNKITYAYNN